MSCENCRGYGQFLRACPTCSFSDDEVGLEYVDQLPDDGLIDVCRPKNINEVVYTMRPLKFFCWAHDCDYKVEIDDWCEITLRTQDRKPEFFAWLQHKDFFHEMDRSGVAELARWM